MPGRLRGPSTPKYNPIMSGRMQLYWLVVTLAHAAIRNWTFSPRNQNPGFQPPEPDLGRKKFNWSSVTPILIKAIHRKCGGLLHLRRVQSSLGAPHVQIEIVSSVWPIQARPIRGAPHVQIEIVSSGLRSHDLLIATANLRGMSTLAPNGRHDRHGLGLSIEHSDSLCMRNSV